MAQAQTIDQEDENGMDCDWAVLLGVRYLGFDVESIMRMRYGQFIDYLITRTEMTNTKKGPGTGSEKGSVMDL